MQYVRAVKKRTMCRITTRGTATIMTVCMARQLKTFIENHAPDSANNSDGMICYERT